MTHFTDKAREISLQPGVEKREKLIAQALQEVAEAEYKRGRETMREEAAEIADEYALAAGSYEAKTSKRKTSECIATAIRSIKL